MPALATTYWPVSRKNWMLLATAAAYLLLVPEVAAWRLAYADFGAYTNGPLVGQERWQQYNIQTSAPLSVESGRVSWPGGSTTNNQDAMLSFNTSVTQPVSGIKVLKFDLVLSVSRPSPSTNASYFAALNTSFTTNTGGNFQNARLVAVASGSGFVFGARVNGQSGYPFVYGTNVLTLGQNYALRAEVTMNERNADDVIRLYVGSDFGNLTLHAEGGYSSGAVSDPTFGAILLSRFGSASVGEPGVSIASVEANVEESGAFTVNLDGRTVPVARWGTGPKGAIFFSHTGSVASDFRSNTALVERLVSGRYSVFVWDYPADIQSAAINTIGPWMAGMLPIEQRPLFPGMASSILAQLREATGLENFLLVGNSFGAGVVLSDYQDLLPDPRCQMLLISPTEPFIPPNLPPLLEKSFMVSDAFNDTWLRRQEDKDFCARNTNLAFPAGTPQPGHIVVGDANSIEYAFTLMDEAFKPKRVAANYSNGSFSMSWTPASSVHVQRRLSLSEDGWTTVLSNATGTNFSEQPAGMDRAFYRLLLP